MLSGRQLAYLNQDKRYGRKLKAALASVLSVGQTQKLRIGHINL